MSASGSSSRPPRPMSRPGTGRVGAAVSLDTNFFRATLPSRLVVSQYAVSIYLDPSSSSIRDVAPSHPVSWNKAVFSAFLRVHRAALARPLAYDGRSICYAAREVPRSCLAVKFPLRVDRDGNPVSSSSKSPKSNKDKVDDIAVEIRHAKYLPFDQVLSPSSSSASASASASAAPALHTEYLTALDVVIAASHIASHVQVGRSFYSSSGAQPLGRRNVTASAWRGFYQSARLSDSGLLINLDESYTAFWNRGGEPLTALIRDANSGRDVDVRDSRSLRDVTAVIKGLRVRAVHTGITYRVHALSSRSADNITFDANGHKVSIADYFHRHYGIRLRNPRAPCVKTNPKKDTYVPIEMLHVAEKQRVMGKLSDDQTRSIVTIASRKPAQRRQAALSVMRELDHKRDPVCKDFGLDVSQKPVTVAARILPTPHIAYTKATVKPDRGAWKAPPRDRCHAPGNLFTWAVINTSDLRDGDVSRFLGVLCARAKDVGINIPNRKPYVVTTRRHPDIPHEMRQLKKKVDSTDSLRVQNARLQLIVVIFDRRDTEMYNAVKVTGDTEVGVATQVLVKKHLYASGDQRGLSQYCDNVLLKMNAKIGGGNFKVLRYQAKGNPRRDLAPDPAFINYPHIVLGADVTHPMAGDSNPSVAALVGSRDSFMGQFSGAIRNQTGRKEVITELGDMFKEVYRRWYDGFGRRFHAASIIMFRDGVSEGQFEEVMQTEIAALRAACLQVSSSWRPRITYMIVTKRHHARFFPQGRSGNIDPGTVIDTKIVSRQFYDFYLNSHAGIMGTNRPAKYTVLVDENNIPVDALQGYIFRLSHSFQRCSRSVSMVSSAYYAHLLAFRGRAYHKDSSDSGSVSSSHSTVPSAPRFHRYLENILFFV